MARKSNNTALNLIMANLNSDLLDNRLSKEVTFAAGTTGAIGSYDIATVTGVVAMSIFGVCSVNVTGTGTIEVGTTLSTAGLIAQTAGSNILAGEIYHDATPDSSIELTSVITKKIVTQTVKYKVTTNTLTGGKIKWYILWTPISDDGNVVIA